MKPGHACQTASNNINSKYWNYCMHRSLAYHVVVNALEGKSGWTPMMRFSSAISHVINGHLPYQRYHAAGKASLQANTGAGVVERMVKDFLATDINPAYLLLASFDNEARVLAAFNSYNQSARLGMQTNLGKHGYARTPGPHLPEHGVDDGKTSAALLVMDDPDTCRQGTLAVVETMLSTTRQNALLPQGPQRRNLASIARLLGVESSPAAEVALVFELEGSLPVADVARKLGCHRRTLERRLREAGLTAESLRQASRLIRASYKLPSTDSLTTIALSEGFSDLAHMTRAFQNASGMPPSLIRKLLR